MTNNRVNHITGKPDYINRNLKEVSKDHLLMVLRQVNEKHEADRREMQRATNEALQSGFYCTCGKTGIKPLN